MSRRRNGFRDRAAAADRRATPSSVRPRGCPPAPAASDDPVEALLTRARKCRHKGDTRRALVLLREACALDPWRARSFTLLGAFLSQLGHRDEALGALQQARWLRARAGEKARAAVTERLAAELRPMAA